MPPRLEEALRITQSYWQRPESVSFSRWLPYRETTLSSEEVERSLFEWDRFRRNMLSFIEDYDLLICPVADGPAPPHGPATPEMYRYQLPYSLTGWPVSVVRCGTSPEGLPIGVQLIARAWQDHVAIAA